MPKSHAPNGVGIDRCIGARVRAARLNAGFSQERLGNALQVSFQAIQKYETGTARIAASTLVVIAEALGVKVSSLLNDSDLCGSEPRPDPPGGPSPQALRLAQFVAEIEDPDVREKLSLLIRSLARQKGPPSAISPSDAGSFEAGEAG